MTNNKTKAVIVGRFCPLHIGHEQVIRSMVDNFGIDNCLVVIGSSNHPISLLHFFSYDERRRFLSKIFPGLKLVGLPDYHNDAVWLTALDDILAVSGIEPKDVLFYGGCKQDVDFFYRFNRNVEIMNRFYGTTPEVSATEVRDALISGRSIEDLVNPLIHDDIKQCFSEKWENFKKI